MIQIQERVVAGTRVFDVRGSLVGTFTGSELIRELQDLVVSEHHELADAACDLSNNTQFDPNPVRYRDQSGWWVQAWVHVPDTYLWGE